MVEADVCCCRSLCCCKLRCTRRDIVTEIEEYILVLKVQTIPLEVEKYSFGGGP